MHFTSFTAAENETPPACVCHIVPCVCHIVPCVCHVVPCVCHAVPCVCHIVPCVCHTVLCEKAEYKFMFISISPKE